MAIRPEAMTQANKDLHTLGRKIKHAANKVETQAEALETRAEAKAKEVADKVKAKVAELNETGFRK